MVLSVHSDQLDFYLYKKLIDGLFTQPDSFNKHNIVYEGKVIVGGDVEVKVTGNAEIILRGNAKVIG